MIELPQMREPKRESSIANIKVYRTPFGVVNDEVSIEVTTFVADDGILLGAMGETELLQLTKDLLKLTDYYDLAEEIEVPYLRAWNQVNKTKESTNGG